MPHGTEEVSLKSALHSARYCCEACAWSLQQLVPPVPADCNSASSPVEIPLKIIRLTKLEKQTLRLALWFHKWEETGKQFKNSTGWNVYWRNASTAVNNVRVFWLSLRRFQEGVLIHSYVHVVQRIQEVSNSDRSAVPRAFLGTLPRPEPTLLESNHVGWSGSFKPSNL